MEPNMAMAGKEQGREFRPLSRDDLLITGIFAGTPVLTLDGAIPVEHLNAGDRIITRAGVVCLRRLDAGVALVTPCKVAPAVLGGGRPEDEIMLPADQHILIRDWRAEALFGRPQAMVQVAKLVDGEYIRQLPQVRKRVFSLVFDEPQVFYASGLELVSAMTVQAMAA